MKADVAQQLLLLELAELDAELVRLTHQAGNLPERQEHERFRAQHTAVTDRLAALQIALDDADTQSQQLGVEIDAVCQRRDRDRGMLDSGMISAKQVSDLQHELETLQRRQDSLENSLLEVLEQREELQGQHDSESAIIDGLRVDLSDAERALSTAMADIETNRRERSARRDEVASAISTELLALYERQRASGGTGAGQLLGNQCGACRIEIDRGELSRISVAPQDDVVQCPECSAILLRVKDFRS